MPLYDYECVACGHVYELRQSFSAEPVDTCPQCAGTSKRKFHAVPIIYKGTGFYTTDYGRPSYATDLKKEKGDDPKDKSKSDKATKDSTEGKSDKTESKADKTEGKTDKKETAKATSGASKDTKEASKKGE